jgi:hypothetical protein
MRQIFRNKNVPAASSPSTFTSPQFWESLQTVEPSVPGRHEQATLSTSIRSALRTIWRSRDVARAASIRAGKIV